MNSESQTETAGSASQLRLAADIMDNGWQWEFRLPDYRDWKKADGITRPIASLVLAGYIIRRTAEPASWSKPEHVPGPVCWLRPCENALICMVVAIRDTGLFIIGHSKKDWLTWEQLRGAEYSTDRVTWKPCTVEAQP